MKLSTASRRAIISARPAEVPVGSEGVKSEIIGRGVRADRIQPGLHPPGVEARVGAGLEVSVVRGPITGEGCAGFVEIDLMGHWTAVGQLVGHLRDRPEKWPP